VTGVSADAELVRPSRLRLIVGWGAIASALPYLTLKLLWLGGSTVGITDAAFADDPKMFALNLFTLVMDVVAIGLALAFTYSWGQRIPAWLLLFPIWVGTGFLGPIIIGAPIAAIASMLIPADRTTDDTSAGLPLADWVVPIVYTGFVLLGVLLLVAFVLYARVRWFEAFTDRTPGLHRADQAVAAAGTLLALVAATILVADALTPQQVVPSAIGLSMVKAAFALAAAAGIWAMLPLGRRRFQWPMLLAWIGSGALFAWGFWSMLAVLGDTPLVTGDVSPRQIVGGVAQLLGGVLLAVVLVRAMRRVTGAAPLS
jgi:hypothetical protein